MVQCVGSERIEDGPTICLEIAGQHSKQMHTSDRGNMHLGTTKVGSKVRACNRQG